MLGGEELFDEESARGEAPGVFAEPEYEELVAQGEEALGFEPDDRRAARRVRRQRRHHPPRFLARLVDQAGGEVGAPAAQRARG